MMLEIRVEIPLVIFSYIAIYRTKHSRMDQVKLVEDSL